MSTRYVSCLLLYACVGFPGCSVTAEGRPTDGVELARADNNVVAAQAQTASGKSAAGKLARKSSKESPKESSKEAAKASAMEGFTAPADLYVVDCLLPGQVRQLGRRTYITPRRPTRTTAANCSLRGGEFVAYDRADYKSALRVWMPSAQAGEPEAQTNVGEIFERGLGGEPNYEAAIVWYQRAAEQGHTRAQFNLGTLYEQGLGVPRDPVMALNWYRRAWDIQEDDVMFRSAAHREVEELRATVERELNEKNAQINVLQSRLNALQDKLNLSTTEGDNLQAEYTTLKTLVDQLESQRQDTKQQLSALATRETQLTAPPLMSADKPSRDTVQMGDVDFGRYYALLIGNAHYSNLEDLNTPLTDLARARRILEDQYGFTVLTIEDGDNIEVMRAINDLYEIVGEEDNLLLFFAGHGNRLGTGAGEIGYWLPSNAEAPPRNTFWVANEFVTGHLSRIRAKRILVVADSCYAGLLSSEPSFLLVGDSAGQYTNPRFLQFKLGKRSRLLLSSGGDSPVLDGGGGGNHSVFAKAFLDELENNAELLPSPELFLRVRDRVQKSAARIDFSQRPEFKTIKSAGHEVGDFFFVPSEL